MRMRKLHGQEGVSLLETIIALGLLAVIGLAFIAALDTGTKSTRTLDEQIEALALARSQLEEIKDVAFNDNPLCVLVTTTDELLGGGTAIYDCYPVTVTVPLQYTVAVRTRLLDKLVDGTPICGSSGACLHQITVSVSRPDKPIGALTGNKKK